MILTRCGTRLLRGNVNQALLLSTAISMRHRERLERFFEFKEVDRVPDYEFGYWTETIDRWHSEGLPLQLHNQQDIEDYFGLEGWDTLRFLPVTTGLWPSPPSRATDDYGDKEVIRDGLGGVYLRTKWASNIPQQIRYPIEKKDDWEKIRPFFNPETPGRMSVDWDEIVKSYEGRTYPLGISVGSLYGWLRNLIGVHNISIAFYRDPDWIGEMMDTLVDLWIKLIRKSLRDVKVDFTSWWEDMCYSSGPLISVKLFEEFMVPRYRKVTDILLEYGVSVNILDCDGKIDALVPGWLRGGINCMFPIEARHTSPLKLKETYGNKLLLMGGVNKLALIAGQKAIEKEIDSLVPLIKSGGYLPMVDHRVPPEVSLSNYVYYLRLKRKAIGRVDAPSLPMP